MKKIFITLSILLLTICVKAQTFIEPEGYLKYEVTSSTDLTVEIIGVEMADLKKLNGITIRDKVTYEGKTYTVTSIRKGAFPKWYEVPNVEYLYIGNFIKELPEECFYRYPVKRFTSGNTLEIIGEEALAYCKQFESYTFSGTITTIGRAAFRDSNLGTSFGVPLRTTTVLDNAFKNTNIEEITFWGPIKTIGDGALRTGSLLTIELPRATTPPTFYYYGPEHPFNTFEDYVYDIAYVKVPEGCADVYRKDKKWGMFKHIVDGPIPTRACEPVKIIFKDGKYNFSCAPPGVQFHSKVETLGTNTGEFTSNSVAMSPSFVKVSVYASKDGFDNSKTTVMTFRNDGTVIGADVNTDGSINAADVVSVYNYIIDGE